ncbi:hypothetical protein BX600DRAFT_518817 [Xylariales sp. PMI_506]|nr:hypothetical protein BX600DRAFT_518817 [Xylariales sp. PMI_506]
MPSFNPQKDIPNLASKVCLVTGANSGLGEAAVAAIAQHNPAKVYLAARSKTKADEAIRRIRATSTPARSANIEFLQLDLASFDSIKAAADRVNKEAPRLDVLQLNGGVAMIAPSTTREGYEVEFGTNYVGHALLTQMLMPKLLETTALPGADVRVVTTSSMTHRVLAPKEGILFDDLHTDMAKVGGPALYAQSMLAKILFTREMAKRYPQITFSSLHPGTVKSPIYSGSKDMNWFVLNCIMRPAVALTGVSNEEGAKTQLWCSFGKGVVSGSYYEPIGKVGKESDLAHDAGLAARLWKWTEEELLKHGASGWPQA